MLTSSVVVNARGAIPTYLVKNPIHGVMNISSSLGNVNSLDHRYSFARYFDAESAYTATDLTAGKTIRFKIQPHKAKGLEDHLRLKLTNSGAGNVVTLPMHRSIRWCTWKYNHKIVRRLSGDTLMDLSSRNLSDVQLSKWEASSGSGANFGNYTISAGASVELYLDLCTFKTGPFPMWLHRSDDQFEIEIEFYPSSYWIVSGTASDLVVNDNHQYFLSHLEISDEEIIKYTTQIANEGAGHYIYRSFDEKVQKLNQSVTASVVNQLNFNGMDARNVMEFVLAFYASEGASDRASPVDRVAQIELQYKSGGKVEANGRITTTYLKNKVYPMMFQNGVFNHKNYYTLFQCLEGVMGSFKAGGANIGGFEAQDPRIEITANATGTASYVIELRAYVSTTIDISPVNAEVYQ